MGLEDFMLNEVDPKETQMQNELSIFLRVAYTLCVGV